MDAVTVTDVVTVRLLRRAMLLLLAASGSFWLTPSVADDAEPESSAGQEQEQTTSTHMS